MFCRLKGPIMVTTVVMSLTVTTVITITIYTKAWVSESSIIQNSECYHSDKTSTSGIKAAQTSQVFFSFLQKVHLFKTLYLWIIEFFQWCSIEMRGKKRTQLQSHVSKLAAATRVWLGQWLWHHFWHIVQFTRARMASIIGLKNLACL